MLAFVILGVIAVVFGFLFILAPRTLIHLSEMANKICMTDDVAIRYRIGVGISLILVGALMFFIAFYLQNI